MFFGRAFPVLVGSCTVKHLFDFRRDAIGRNNQRRIQVHIALCNTTCGMAKQSGNRQLRKRKVARNAGERMPLMPNAALEA